MPKNKQKQEKAKRNAEYAKKYRKRTPSRFARKPGFGGPRSGSDNDASVPS